MQDEIFHVPQAERICRGVMEWDPKITTPAGLYYVPVLYQRIAPLIGLPSSCEDITTLEWLRSVSFVCMILFCGVIMASITRNQTSMSVYAPLYRSLVTLAVVSLPPMYFFGFLYYTDMLSTFLVFLALTFSQMEEHFTASLLGMLAMTVRQNNVVWVAFMIGQAMLAELRRHAPGLAWSRTPPLGLLLKKSVWEDLGGIELPYIPAIFGFVGFVLWNQGSLALGDKSNHQVTFHLPQLGYFFAFALFFGWPALVPHMRLRIRRKQVLIFAALTALGLVAVHFFTVVHPFLLADNRHYTFYVWRRIVDVRPWARYALVPVYVASAMLWISALGTYLRLPSQNAVRVLDCGLCRGDGACRGSHAAD